MVNASRLTYPHCRGAGCTAGTSVLRPAMPVLSRPYPHPIHVITVDIHQFRAQVVHRIPGLRRATTAHGTKQDRQDSWRSYYGQPTGPASFLTATAHRT
jgi:hypothetical protein